MAVLTVPKALRDKSGEEATDALVTLVNASGDEGRAANLAISEEKFGRRLAEEMGKIRVEIVDLKTELKSEIGGLRSELKTEIGSVRSEIKTEIAESKSEIIKWLFIFWIGQIGVMTGIVFALLRTMIR